MRLRGNSVVSITRAQPNTLTLFFVCDNKSLLSLLDNKLHRRRPKRRNVFTITLIGDIKGKREIILPAGQAKFNWIDIENIRKAGAILLDK